MLDYIYYCEDSPSKLRWLISRGNRAAGDVAGYLDMTCGYWRVARSNRSLAHRLIWQLHKGHIPSGFIVDHEDGNKTNNLIDNLRLVTNPVNARNTKMYGSNTSGTVGVFFYKERPHRNISAGWMAGWYDPSGKLQTKSFSSRKYGEERARELAILYREAQIKLLNESGAGILTDMGQRRTYAKRESA